MNTVEAVKTRQDIEFVTRLLEKNSKGDSLYADIWKFGINVALRISDLLAIEFDSLDMKNKLYKLREQKTGKTREIRLNDAAIGIIEKRRNAHLEDVYLFQGHSNRASGKPVSRQMVARKFKEVGQDIGIELSTHSMRKTRGYIMHKDGKPIEMIAKVLNHSSPAITMDYLGITRQDILDTYDEYQL